MRAKQVHEIQVLCLALRAGGAPTDLGLSVVQQLSTQLQ